jgi:predicted amidophosphoribosyltransferase
MASLLAAPVPDIVTWAPTTAVRRRQRGFDQAELLARAVARRLGLPCRSLLARRPGPPQTGRALAERRGGPGFRPRRAVSGRSVLIVDDVVTSGSTAAAAAGALRSAGARSVVVLAAARTPRPSTSR